MSPSAVPVSLGDREARAGSSLRVPNNPSSSRILANTRHAHDNNQSSSISHSRRPSATNSRNPSDRSLHSVQQSSSSLLTPSRTRPDPRKIRKYSELRAYLSQLTAREAELSITLNALVTNRQGLDSRASALQELVPRLRKVEESIDGHRSQLPQSQSPSNNLAGDSRSSRHGSPSSPPGSKRNAGSFEKALFERHRKASAGMPAEGPMDDLNSERRNDFLDEEEEEREAEEKGLVGRVAVVWETSERVGGKVKKLDEEVSRVQESAERVGEVLELKLALSNLRDAIAKEDWELATRCCKRAMDVPEEVLESAFAARVVPSSNDPLPPSQALTELRNQLLNIFRTNFKEAAERKDEQTTSRFFKLFPSIGAEEEGLSVYSDFVVGLVKARSTSGGRPSSPLYYISHLTSLLESIALIIDQHQEVVEKYYGEGKMLKVMERLQAEADRVVRGLVEGWEEERRVGRLIADTRQSSFAYLKQPVQAPTSAVNASLAALSQAQQNIAHLPTAATSLLANYAGSRIRQQQPQAEEMQKSASDNQEEAQGPDPRDVDGVLGEMVALSGRWSLYRRFVWNRLSDVDEDEEDVEKLESSPIILRLKASDSHRAVEHMMRTYYEPLEAWYLRSSVEKAHKLDIPDLSSLPFLSSVVDDVFYLLKIALGRLISTGFLPILTNVHDQFSRILERDYLGVLRKKLDAVYSTSTSSLASLPGQSREAERERKERDLRISCSVLLNDLEMSAQYMDRLVEDLLTAVENSQSWLEPEIDQVQDQLRSFSELSTRMRSMAKAGIEQVFNQRVRPKLKNLLEDVYKGVTYLLDEDAYHEAEVDDLVRKRFIAGWEPVTSGYKSNLTDGNFQHFFLTTIEMLVRPWEKMVQGMRFTELGAIRFDRDVRAVANYLSTQSEFGGARDKFTRLQQISTILNLDSDEDAEDFYGSSGIPWRLSKAEYNQVVALRA